MKFITHLPKEFVPLAKLSPDDPTNIVKLHPAVRFNSSLGKAVIGICLAMLIAVHARAIDWSAKSATAYDKLFQRTNGWIGADGDFTVALTNGLTLWLFNDTLIGKTRGDHRVSETMIHNSAAWQLGNNPSNAQVKFFYGLSPHKRPTPLVKPADGKGWFWPYSGVLVQGKLFFFLDQIEHTDDKSVFGFRQIGVWLAEVSNPFAPPTRWNLKQTKIPFARFHASENLFFGSALFVTNGFVYIFGTRAQADGRKTMILARAPETGLEDFATWRFRSINGWSKNAREAANLCSEMANEYSVSWSPALQRYVLIYTENGLSEEILARTAIEPWGPWTSGTVVYRCPEAKWNRQIFCYAAKAHPMLTSATNEFIVTYAANSFDFTQLINDARLYWPRFVRITLN